MAIGFDIYDDGMVSSTKNVVEPTNFQDQYDDSEGSGAGGGNQDDPAPNQSWSDYVDEVIPNIELSKNAKQDFIDNLPENKKPYAYLGIGALIYYLFLS